MEKRLIKPFYKKLEIYNFKYIYKNEKKVKKCGQCNKERWYIIYKSRFAGKFRKCAVYFFYF